MIATVLLVAIAMILAIIIFIWAKSVIGESVLKNDEPVERACDDVEFYAEAFNNGNVDVENLGTVALYGVEIRRKDSGSLVDVGSFRSTIFAGETASVNIGSSSISDTD